MSKPNRSAPGFSIEPNTLLTEKRKQQLEDLASIGAALSIFDPDTLLDIEEFLNTTKEPSPYSLEKAMALSRQDQE